MMINRMDSIKTIGPISLFFFWFVFFGSAKKMNKTVSEKAWGLKHKSQNNSLFKRKMNIIFDFQKRLGR